MLFGDFSNSLLKWEFWFYLSLFLILISILWVYGIDSYTPPGCWVTLAKLLWERSCSFAEKRLLLNRELLFLGPIADLSAERRGSLYLYGLIEVLPSLSNYAAILRPFARPSC